jgi:phosphatidylinositol 4-kinase B
MYLLQVKDRHNGNLLINSTGHIIHIDFGFMLSNAPGGAFAFENAPFKLTADYLGLIGGVSSSMFEYFKILLIQGFIALRKYVDDLCDIVDIMSRESCLPCFEKFSLKEFKDRFKPSLLDTEVRETHAESQMGRRAGAGQPFVQAYAVVR